MQWSKRFPISLCVAAIAAAAVVEACPAATLWVDAASTADAPDGSTAAPFATIGEAVAAVQPGDTVEIRGGIYRERFRIPSGEPGRPITVRAAAGQAVVVSGCEPLDGWKPAGDGVFSTMLDWQPTRLLVGRRQMPLAREPNEGWWTSTAAESRALIDPAHLKNHRFAASGGEAYVWLGAGNTFATLPIRAIDGAGGRLEFGETGRPPRLSDGDRYWLQNRREWIDRPGEWAVEPAGEGFRVFFRPREKSDLDAVEAPKADRALVLVRDADHVRIEGLEVVGSRHYGIEVHIAEDVSVRRCIAHHHDRCGISLRDVKDGTVAENISWLNGSGISVSYSSRVTVERNDVGHNLVDGILVTWKSNDIAVRRNYVHHHLLWGHPDNVQIYRDVRNVRFEENLLLAGGQSVMSEETRDGVFVGNMLIGSAANMLIFGHSNAGHYRVERNTLAFSGYGVMNLTWENYQVAENVMMNGHGSFLFGIRGVSGYRGDRNLFWNTGRVEKAGLIATDKGWHRSLAEVQQAAGCEGQSVYADPKFRNAPIAVAVCDSRRMDECGRASWPMRRAEGLFRPGDLVEVNFDGVRRRITRVEGEGPTITVDRPLAAKPLKGWIVANWGDQPGGALDLRLADDSPGARLAADGGPIGSQIEVAAYQRGDFDGDGRRDLPPMPPGLAPE